MAAVVERVKVDPKRLKDIENRLKDVRANFNDLIEKGDFLRMMSPQVVIEAEWMLGLLKSFVRRQEEDSGD